MSAKSDVRNKSNMNNKPGVAKQRRPSAKPGGADGWWRSPMVWLFSLVVVAGVITIIIAANDNEEGSTALTSQTAVAETALAETDGPPLPPFEDPDPAIGMQAPTVSAETFQGDRVELAADGTARLFGFFAHWCPHCQSELPATVDWLENNTLPEDVEVVAISTAVDEEAENYPPSDWFAREDWPATVLIDDADSSLASGFGLAAFPFWVAVDADGTVVARVSGSMPAAQFEALVLGLGATVGDAAANSTTAPGESPREEPGGS